MSFIDVNLGEDVKEAEAAPEGEYELLVDDVYEYDKEYDDGTTGRLIRVKHLIQDTGDVTYKPVYHYLSLPNESDDRDKVQMKLLMIKRYLTMAGIPFDQSGFNVEDLYGARFTAKLTQEVYEATGDISNSIQVPRLEG